MRYLYLYFLGGTARGANIEVHDVQFAAVNKPEDAHNYLVKNWFGEPELLHIDVETKINWADGYDVTISDASDDSEFNLYFVNMGGFVGGDVDEKHSFDFVVAKSKDEAKNRAKRMFSLGNVLIHKDILFDVDECLLIKDLNGKHVTLTPNPNGRRETPTYRYIPIGANTTRWDPVTDIVTTADGSRADDIRAPVA